jgi:hypothetical protein
MAQIGAQILNPETQVFELLDEQRKAFAVCRAAIHESFIAPISRRTPKKVIIITGPPGSGKSVIAARLWASLVTDPALPDGDVVFTTTSMSQNSNWSHLFDQAAGLPAAGGVVRKATAYSPITNQQLGQLRTRHGDAFLADPHVWRDNLATLQATETRFREGARDNLVTIVDEAHALINPEDPQARGQFLRGLRTVMRAAAAVGQGLAGARPLHPLAHGGVRHGDGAADSPRRAPQLDHLPNNFRSTIRRQPGILVDVHPGIPFIMLACLATTSFDESPRMDNPPANDLVRLHS